MRCLGEFFTWNFVSSSSTTSNIPGELTKSEWVNMSPGADTERKKNTMLGASNATAWAGNEIC